MTRSCLAATIALALLATLEGRVALARGPACPEARTTKKAPDEFYNRANPLAPGALDKKGAEVAFFGDGLGIACASCHARIWQLVLYIRALGS